MNEVATTNRSPLSQLRSDIKAALPTFGLPDERAQARMSSVLMVAVEKDPELVFADRQSLIAATRQCANHGLVPDGNEAFLTVYNTKVKRNGKEEWIKKVQYQPMVRGIINRVERSGKVKRLWAEVVYQGEGFHIDMSKGDRRPVHTVDNWFNRGNDEQIVGVYAVAYLENGTIDCEPMDRAELAKVQNVAKTKNVWNTWFSEKAKVAAMRRLSKRLPLSAEDLDMIMNRDEHDLEPPRDITPPERQNLAQRLQGALESPSDPITGEIMDDGHWTDTVDLSDATPMDDEFDDGAKAFKAGIARTDCPLTEHREAAPWLAGWDQAKKFAEEKDQE